MSTGGKGSHPRPIPNRKQFEENWDKIFGKKEPKHVKKKTILWVLCPGYVRSKNDCQTHYVTEKQLKRLYDMRYFDYVLSKEDYEKRKDIRPEEVNVIRLHPRYNGDYLEYKNELLRNIA